MHRIPTALPKSLFESVQNYAKMETTSLSIMCWKLIAEAVKFRKEKEADDGDRKKPLKRSLEG